MEDTIKLSKLPKLNTSRLQRSDKRPRPTPVVMPVQVVCEAIAPFVHEFHVVLRYLAPTQVRLVSASVYAEGFTEKLPGIIKLVIEGEHVKTEANYPLKKAGVELSLEIVLDPMDRLTLFYKPHEKGTESLVWASLSFIPATVPEAVRKVALALEGNKDGKDKEVPTVEEDSGKDL